LAVLDVIEVESLQRNAFEVGRYLRERLLVLRKDYPALGEIHGSGLLLGIDIVKPDGASAPKLAGRIMNHMRDHGVLIGATGPKGNVLKLRPPIVFQKEHAEITLLALAKALEKFSNLNVE
jgi:4-aminobutyrate aminotransferase-like enzyme